MTRFRCERAMLRLAVLIAGISCCAVAPAQAADDTGGARMPDVIAPATGGAGYGEAGTRSLVARPAVLLGRLIDIRGTMPHGAHRQVILQRLDARRGWRNVARTRVRSSDRFLVRWHADRSGRISLRAVLAPRTSSDRTSSRAAGPIDRAATAAAPVVGVTVYRPATATFYGPGFFGRQTACGVTLTPETHGVAHRRLPCGTLVLIMYRGRQITVPVIDRGPFAGSYTWDLTQATADALGFQAGAIGYTRVAAPATPAAPAA